VGNAKDRFTISGYIPVLRVSDVVRLTGDDIQFSIVANCEQGRANDASTEDGPEYPLQSRRNVKDHSD
jgi:hypothetical protein